MGLDSPCIRLYLLDNLKVGFFDEFLLLQFLKHNGVVINIKNALL